MSSYPKRSLEELTRDECRNLFAYAFGYMPDPVLLHVFPDPNYTTITDGTYSVILFENGELEACKATMDGIRPTPANVKKVLTCLNRLNIQFGEEASPDASPAGDS